MENRQIRWGHILAMTAMTLALWPGTSPAQESEESEEVERPRAQSVELADGQVVVPRPTGWNIIKPGVEAEATFRAATDPHAQIEIRLSESVSQARWEYYLRSYDSELQQAGFRHQGSRTAQSYAGMTGYLYEYQFEREDETYRLVVWHTHERDRAWVFTGFFTEGRRDAHFQTFEEMLQGVQWPE